MEIKPGLSTAKMLPRYKDVGHVHNFWHREAPITGRSFDGRPILYGYRFICVCGAEIVDDLSQPFKDKDTLIKEYLARGLE